MIVEVDYPALNPGTCIGCTGGPSPERERWFDFQQDVWKFGRLYLCSLCVTNLVNTLGINPDQALQARILELEFENDRGNHALTVLAGLRLVFESMDLESPDPESILEPGSKGAKEPASK